MWKAVLQNYPLSYLHWYSLLWSACHPSSFTHLLKGPNSVGWQKNSHRNKPKKLPKPKSNQITRSLIQHLPR